MSDENEYDDVDELADDDLDAPRDRLALFWTWVGAMILAGVLTTLFQLVYAPQPRSVPDLLLIIGISLGAQGVIFGVLGWLILQAEIPGAIWWIPATILGTLIGVYLEYGAYYALILPLLKQMSVTTPPATLQIIQLGANMVVSALLSGLAVGIAQWLVLRQAGISGALWIPITGLSILLRYLIGTGASLGLNWLFGKALFDAGIAVSSSAAQILTPVIVAIIGNLAFGALSGWMLVNLIGEEDEDVDQEIDEEDEDEE